MVAANVLATMFNARMSVLPGEAIPPRIWNGGEESSRRKTKLDLLAICASSVWELGAMPEVFRKEHETLYLSELGFARNRWLWVIMADIRHMFKKGISCIR